MTSFGAEQQSSSEDKSALRPAATVMLIRDVADGIEVFMLQRTHSAAFAGGMYVFPGGRVAVSYTHLTLPTIYSV